MTNTREGHSVLTDFLSFSLSLEQSMISLHLRFQQGYQDEKKNTKKRIKNHQFRKEKYNFFNMYLFRKQDVCSRACVEARGQPAGVSSLCVRCGNQTQVTLGCQYIHLLNLLICPQIQVLLTDALFSKTLKNLSVRAFSAYNIQSKTFIYAQLGIDMKMYTFINIQRRKCLSLSLTKYIKRGLNLPLKFLKTKQKSI